MARELVKKNVDGKTYEFEQFGAKKSLTTLTRLTKLLGEPLMLMMGAATGDAGADKKSVLDKSLNPDILAKAVKALVDRLDQDEVINLVEMLTATSAMCDGKPIQFDSHYEGKIGHLFKVLYAALEVQYGDFFGAITGGLVSRS